MLCIRHPSHSVASSPLVAQIKVNIFNIWPKINTLISSFTFFWGVRGIAVKIMTPMGCLMGLGVISR